MYRFYKNEEKYYLLLSECFNLSTGKQMIYYSEIEHGAYGERFVMNKEEFLQKYQLCREVEIWPTEELYKKTL